MKVPRKKQLLFIYEVMLPVLALFSLFTLVALGASYFHPEKQPLFIFVVDHLIWAVFAADFCVRLCFAQSFRDFLAAHISEFTAIIPVSPFIMLNYALELLKWEDTSSLLIQLVFFIKFLAYLGRAYATQSRFFKTNLLHYAGGITMVSIVVAALLFSNFERISYGDAIWFSFVTVSTTGYGDIVPHTEAGRVVSVFLMVIGVACISSFTSILAGRIMNNTGSKQRNPHLIAVERQIRRFSLLSEDEVEELCLVLKSLKHHQKISAVDIKEKIDAFNAAADVDVRWHNLPFVRWVRVKFAGVMTDGIEMEAKIAQKKDGGGTDASGTPPASAPESSNEARKKTPEPPQK